MNWTHFFAIFFAFVGLAFLLGALNTKPTDHDYISFTRFTLAALFFAVAGGLAL